MHCGHCPLQVVVRGLTLPLPDLLLQVQKGSCWQLQKQVLCSLLALQHCLLAGACLAKERTGQKLLVGGSPLVMHNVHK